jgi:hypothetical protein
MWHDLTGAKRAASCLLVALALIGFAAVACTEIRPEPNVEQGGVLESSTHEADSLRRAEERQEQNRGGGGGGGSY